MVAPILLMLAALAALPQPDPYAPPPVAGTPERLAYDAELGGPREDDAIQAWLAANPDAAKPVRSMLYHRLCNDYGVLVGGEKRVAACTAAIELASEGDDASDLKIAVSLRGEPPVTASGGAIIPGIANPLGSRSADVTVNGVTLPWFMDTGAEITTITETTAKKIGVRRLEGAPDVGTSTNNRVTGTLGMIDKLTIGSATVEHLPVLILPDAMLTITKDYTIPAIFGLPAFAALGRVAWIDGGATVAVGSAAPMPTGKTVRVYWHEDGLGIPLRTQVGVAGAQFDSGADSTALWKSGLSLLTKEQVATATERDVKVGGAGGVMATKMKVLPRFDYTLAGVPITAVKLNVEDNKEGAGRIGNDMIAQTRLLSIDFATMTLQVEPRSK